MNNEINKILAEIFIEAAGKNAENAIHDHSQLLDKIDGLLTSLRLGLSKKESVSKAVWSDIRNVFTELDKLCRDIHEKQTLPYFSNFTEDLEKKIAELIKKSENSIETTLTQEMLESEDRKGFSFRSWRSLKLSSIKIKKAVTGKPVEIKRSFNRADIVNSFWTTPFIRKAHGIYATIYRKMINDIGEIHERLEDFQDTSMFFDTFNTVFFNIEKEKMDIIFSEIDKTVELIDEKLKTATELKENSKKDITELSEAISRSFLFNLKYAGSMIVPSSSFSSRSIQAEREKIDRKINKMTDSWVNYYRHLISSWLKDIELSELQFNTALSGIEIAEMISQKHSEKIDPALNSIKELVTESSSDLTSLQGPEEDTKKQIMLKNRSLLKSLRTDLLPALLESIRKTNYRGFLDHFLEKITAFSAEIDDFHTIITKHDPNQKNPSPSIDKIPTKMLIRYEIEVTTSRKAAAFSEKTKLSQEKLLRRINDIDAIINSNFDASINILRENETETAKAIEVASEGLKRTGVVVEELAAEFDTIKKYALDFCTSITGDLIRKTEDFSVDEKVLELKMLLMREMTLKKIGAFFSLVSRFFGNISEKTVSLFKGTFSISRKQLSNIRKMTGLSANNDAIGFGFTQYLNSTEKNIQKLPYVYQRLFRMEALTSEDLFVARKSELNTVKQDYTLWKEGAVASIALYGEKGSGKTTLINIAKSTFLASSQIINIELSGTISEEKELLSLLAENFKIDEKESFDRFEEILVNESSRRICIIENIENLYLRTVDGFSAIERFLLLISRTHHNVFWIVSSSLYAYMYLDSVIEIKKYFQRSIFMEPLTEESVEETILSRHFSSGYSLIFQENDLLKKRKMNKIRDEQEKQALIRKSFFAELSRISDGNIFNAIVLWLNSIMKVEDEKIIMRSYIISEYAFISQLPKDTLFVLAAIIQHDSITIENYMKIFHEDRDSAARMLERLTTNGVLQKKGYGYSIHPFLFKPVVKILKQNNIIY